MEKVARAATKVPEIVFISSTGIFEDGNFEVDETTEPKPDTDSGRALLATEQLFSNNAQFSATIIRFAGLIGPGRNLAKFFAGKTAIANGRAPINLITLQDCIGLCLQLLKTKKFGGIYHAVTPQHPSRNEFYTRLCEVSHMEKPSFKDELLAWKQINSLHVPSQLSYTFKVQNWFDWMDAKLGGRL
jgi:nucleoside-diphosphate-sugar epimerase